jgi:hypothetical protein
MGIQAAHCSLSLPGPVAGSSSGLSPLGHRVEVSHTVAVATRHHVVAVKPVLWDAAGRSPVVLVGVVVGVPKVVAHLVPHHCRPKGGRLPVQTQKKDNHGKYWLVSWVLA